MTTEQHLIATLKEAIEAIREHDEHERTGCGALGDDLIEKWLAIRVRCRTCDGYGQIKAEYWQEDSPFVRCQTCNGTGKRPLSEVI